MTTIGERANLEVILADSKRHLEETIIKEAKLGKRSTTLPSLLCHSEHNKYIMNWLKSENIHVEYKEEKAKPTGLATSLREEDELVTVTYFLLKWA